MTMKPRNNNLKSANKGSIDKLLNCNNSFSDQSSQEKKSIIMNIVKNQDNEFQTTSSSNPELEQIWNELNSDNNNETIAYKYDNNITDNNITDNSDDYIKYTKDEIVKIVSNDNRKILTVKIQNLQKTEWIEIFRIVKNNETKHYQENNSGIWIVMNKLQDETIIKLHQFVECSITNKQKLESEKIQRNRIRDQIKSGETRNNEEFIKNSELLKNITTDNSPSGVSIASNGISGIGCDTESNLKVKVDVDNKLSLIQLNDMVSQRLLARMEEDIEFSPEQ